ncbi:MAG: hypothetical protein R3293_00030 [Candidatus Promineifilaceae bacterium]|nr:hypothetical protein [Candidatus Promineifilaceae bacterium]
MNIKNLWQKSIKLGSVGGLDVHAKPSAFLTFILLWILSSLLGVKLARWRTEKAVFIGFLASVIHLLSETWHQIGHSRMAEQTGYPMEGIVFWGPLATSKYPANEGMLSAEMHIQRALGGPIFSILLALVAGTITLVLRPLGGPPLILVFFTFLDNLLVFTIGALSPLSFTDGGTLVRWWGQRQSGKRFLNLS